ncbi:MAG: type II toxin-antitoxin system VapC family toxin [Burkholderiales bacterium]|nr:type II toxin-antitoxin system VapC family toxin [Burkholderiales bacterium]
MRFMLDTNICIYLIGQQPPQVRARFLATPLGDVVMSVVTYAELRHGIERCPAEDRVAASQALQRMIARVPVLPFGEQDAHSFGVLAAAVPDRRRDAMDRLIAAHAVSMGCILVTNNEADFKDYPGVQVENWTLKPEPAAIDIKTMQNEGRD